MTPADIIQADAGGRAYIIDVGGAKARVVNCQCGDLMRQRWCTGSVGFAPCSHGELREHILYVCEPCGRWTLGEGKKVTDEQMMLFEEAPYSQPR